MIKRLTICAMSFFLVLSISFSPLCIFASAALVDAADIISSEAWDYITMGAWRRAIDAYFNGTATEDHGPYWSSSYWGKNNHVFVFDFGGSGTEQRSGHSGRKHISDNRKGDEK